MLSLFEIFKKEKQFNKGTDICICPKCGKEVPHERGVPCDKDVCPECGVSMVGRDASKQQC